MRELKEQLMNNNKPIFSIDKINNRDGTCTVFVLFDDNSKISKIVKNNVYANREYTYLRKHKLGVTL